MLLLTLLSSQSCFPVLDSQVCQGNICWQWHFGLIWHYCREIPKVRAESIKFLPHRKNIAASFSDQSFISFPGNACFTLAREQLRTYLSISAFSCCILCWGVRRECSWVRPVNDKGACWLTPQNAVGSLTANSNNFQSLPVLGPSQWCLFESHHNALSAAWTIQAFSLKLVRNQRSGGVKSQGATLKFWEH